MGAKTDYIVYQDDYYLLRKQSNEKYILVSKKDNSYYSIFCANTDHGLNVALYAINTKGEHVKFSKLKDAYMTFLRRWQSSDIRELYENRKLFSIDFSEVNYFAWVHNVFDTVIKEHEKEKATVDSCEEKPKALLYDYGHVACEANLYALKTVSPTKAHNDLLKQFILIRRIDYKIFFVTHNRFENKLRLYSTELSYSSGAFHVTQGELIDEYSTAKDFFEPTAYTVWIDKFGTSILNWERNKSLEYRKAVENIKVISEGENYLIVDTGDTIVYIDKNTYKWVDIGSTDQVFGWHELKSGKVDLHDPKELYKLFCAGKN